MKTLSAILFIQIIFSAELSPPLPTFTAAQGQAVVIRLDDVACREGRVGIFNTFYYCRPDNAVIVGIYADMTPGTYPITTFDETKTFALLTITKSRWQTVHRRTSVAQKPASLEKDEHDTLAKMDAYLTDSDPHWKNYHLQVPLRTPISVEYRVGDGFGQQRFYGANTTAQPHNGADIGPSVRDGWTLNPPTALSIAAGVVVLAENLWQEGNTVILYHGDGVYSAYCHLEDLNVEKGSLVSTGYPIGTIGRSGHASGVHLHLTMRIRDVYVDPTLAPIILNRALK